MEFILWEINKIVLLEFLIFVNFFIYFNWNFKFLIVNVLLIIKILGFMLMVIVKVKWINILLEYVLIGWYKWLLMLVKLMIFWICFFIFFWEKFKIILFKKIFLYFEYLGLKFEFNLSNVEIFLLIIMDLEVGVSIFVIIFNMVDFLELFLLIKLIILFFLICIVILFNV